MNQRKVFVAKCLTIRTSLFNKVNFYAWRLLTEKYQISGFQVQCVMLPFDQQDKKALGWWTQGKTPPALGDDAIKAAIQRVTSPIFLLRVNDQFAIGQGGCVRLGDPAFIPSPSDPESYPILAYAPPLHPECLGDPHFKQSPSRWLSRPVGGVCLAFSVLQG
jgi:hypothetical protein